MNDLDLVPEIDSEISIPPTIQAVLEDSPEEEVGEVEAVENEEMRQLREMIQTVMGTELKTVSARTSVKWKYTISALFVLLIGNACRAYPWHLSSRTKTLITFEIFQLQGRLEKMIAEQDSKLSKQVEALEESAGLKAGSKSPGNKKKK